MAVEKTGPVGQIVASMIFLLVILIPGFSSAVEHADTVMRGGEIYTVDNVRSWAESLAIRGNKIVFIGSDDDVHSYIGPGTTVIELNGKMVLPGFQDSHVHPSDQMIKLMCDVVLRRIPSGTQLCYKS